MSEWVYRIISLLAALAFSLLFMALLYLTAPVLTRLGVGGAVVAGLSMGVALILGFWFVLELIGSWLLED